MEKLLIICEKPSAARHFAQALGGVTGTFEGDTYAIVHLYGHILRHGKPMDVAVASHKQMVGEFSQTEGIPWSPAYFDFYQKQVIPSTPNFDGPAKAYQAVKSYLSNGYIPVIASDIDTFGEGDLLVQEVLDHLNYQGKRYREYHISEEVPNIIQAMQTKKEVTAQDPAYLTGFTRDACDFMTQQYTRLVTMSIQRQGYRLPAVVPFGRVQSAILSLVGDQLEAIAQYKPSSVWESRYRLDDLILKADEMPQFPTKEAWDPQGLPPQAKVVKVKEVAGTTQPPKPLTLTKLSALMSRQGISVKQTLEIAQKLYENGDGSGRNYLSYPRTEDNTITHEQFQEALPMVDKYIELLGLPKDAFTHRTPRSTHVKDEGAHGALRPGAVPTSLEELDKRFGYGASLIYQTVTERFLLMFLENTEWIRHEYQTETNPIFKGSVKVITRQGVIDPDAKPEGDVVTQLPDISKMAELYPHEVKSVKPKNPTTAWLLSQLEKHGVGTPATQPQTVSKMVGATDKHPLQDGKVLSLSPLGKVGYEAAKGTQIGSIEGTLFIQSCIQAVRKGESTPQEALQAFADVIAKDVAILKGKTYDLQDFPKQKVKERAQGLWQGKEVAFSRTYGSHRFTDEEVQSLLRGETLTIVIDGKPDAQGKVTQHKVRGALAILEYQGRSYVGFDGKFIREDRVEGIWQGKPVSFKNSFAGHTFTPNEIQDLLANKTITIQTQKGAFTGKLANQIYQGKSFVGFKAEFPKREGYVYGKFQGKDISFKGEFMKHVFTQQEIQQLLNGEEITIVGTDRHGQQRTVSGVLAKQSYQGRTYYGFKAIFDNRT